MKKLYMIMITSLWLLASCKKDDSKPAEPILTTTADKVAFKWTFIETIFNDYQSTGTISDTIKGVSGDYWDFRKDNKCYSFWDGLADTVNYSILNDSTMKYAGDTFKIIRLTSTDFQFRYENKIALPNYDNTIYLKK